jgi:hypothetical protein
VFSRRVKLATPRDVRINGSYVSSSAACKCNRPCVYRIVLNGSHCVADRVSATLN